MAFDITAKELNELSIEREVKDPYSELNADIARISEVYSSRFTMSFLRILQKEGKND